MGELEKMRIDKWLWAARFYKTRAIAVKAIERDRVQINGQNVKPARDVRVGDEVLIKLEREYKTVMVQGLSSVRGPAPVAQKLYEETPESILKREQEREKKRFIYEPANQLKHGRPTKRQRRELDRVRRRWDD